MAFAWPMCRYPLGSGGKRVCTRPPCLPALMSWIMMSRMKLDRVPDSVEDSAEDSTGTAPASDSNKFICLYYLPYEHFETEWPIGHIQIGIINQNRREKHVIRHSTFVICHLSAVIVARKRPATEDK